MTDAEPWSRETIFGVWISVGVAGLALIGAVAGYSIRAVELPIAFRFVFNKACGTVSRHACLHSFLYTERFDISV
jgi:hypothetical protein